MQAGKVVVGALYQCCHLRRSGTGLAPQYLSLDRIPRYAIDDSDASADWSVAETHVRKTLEDAPVAEVKPFFFKSKSTCVRLGGTLPHVAHLPALRPSPSTSPNKQEVKRTALGSRENAEKVGGEDFNLSLGRS